MFNDNLNPGWLFYPSDLVFFIDFEIADRQARVTAPRPRRVPNSKMYLKHQKYTSAVPQNTELPLYTRHALSPEMACNLRQINGEKGWHVHPIAAIRNAWRALGTLRGNRIPSQDRTKLSYLLDLYRAPPDEHVIPPTNLSPRPSPHSSDKGSGDDDSR